MLMLQKINDDINHLSSMAFHVRRHYQLRVRKDSTFDIWGKITARLIFTLLGGEKWVHLKRGKRRLT